METIHNIGPTFFTVIENTLRSCSVSYDVDTKMKQISESIEWHEELDKKHYAGKDYSYDADVMIMRDMFICGDEPIDYIPDIKDHFYLVDTLSMRDNGCDLAMRRDYWKLVTSKTQHMTNIMYSLKDCHNISISLAIANLLVQIFEGARYKLVTGYMPYDEKGLLNSSRGVNADWIKSVIRVLETRQDGEKGSMMITGPDVSSLIVSYNFTRTEVKSDGV